jgi:hypothetical protein
MTADWKASQIMFFNVSAKGRRVLVPSARTKTGFNIVVFPDSLRTGSSISLIGDDLENKHRSLKKNQRLAESKQA